MQDAEDAAPSSCWYVPTGHCRQADDALAQTEGL